MQKKSIDPVDIKIAAQEGQLKAYVYKEHIYIKDTSTQETVIIGGLEKAGDGSRQKTDEEKLELANSRVANLVYNMVDYMKGYVGRSNCPYKYALVGAGDIKKPQECDDCENCKESFWTDLTSELLDKNIVE